jgi:hypothetical protein
LAVVTPRLTPTTRVRTGAESPRCSLPSSAAIRERILHRGKAGVENPVERENVDKHGRNSIKNVDLAKRIGGLFLLSSGSSLHQQRGDRW